MKKLLCVLFSVTMIISMTACSSSKKSPTTTSPVKIVWYTQGASGTTGGDSRRAIVKEYTDAHPNVSIDWVTMNQQTGADTFFKTAIAGGQEIDIADINVQFYRDYVKRGYLQPLDKLLDISKINLISAAWDEMKYFAMKSGNYGVPTALSNCGFYYNVDMFKQYNLSVPKTWDDIKAMKAVLAPHGIYPLVYAGKETWWNPMNFNMIFYQLTGNNGIAVNDKFMKGDFSADVIKPYVDTISYITDLVTSDVYMPGTQGMDSNTAAQEFVQGKAAMYYHGVWFQDTLKKYPNFKYDVFPVPTIGTGTVSQTPGSVGDILCIPSTSKHTDVAADLITSLTTSDNLSKYVSDQGDIVNIAQTTTDTSASPVLQKFDQMAPSTVIWLDAIWEPEIITDFQTGVQTAILGKKTPQQVMDGIVTHYKQLRTQGKTYY